MAPSERTLSVVVSTQGGGVMESGEDGTIAKDGNRRRNVPRYKRYVHPRNEMCFRTEPACI